MMRNSRHLLATLAALLLLFSASLHAQENKNVTWTVLTPKVSGMPGKTVDVKIQATIASGWHMYTMKTYPDSVMGPQSLELAVGDQSVFSLGGRLKAPRPIVHHDENFDVSTEFWKGTVVLTVPVKIAKNAKLGTTANGWADFKFQTCSDKSCIPLSDKKLTFQVEITDKPQTDAAIDTAAKPLAATLPVDTATAPPRKIDTVATAMTPPATADTAKSLADASKGGIGTKEDVPAKRARKVTGSREDIEAARKAGLAAFLGLAIIMGFTSLFTPCVFPMIPITVSFFTKRRQTTRARAIRDAALYGVGIILTFTLLGLILTIIRGATGVSDFATNPVVAICMALIFLALALNMFGLFEIQLPNSLINKLNERAQGDSVSSVIVMGVVFSLTSFTCTVPFVGNLLFSASTGDYLWPLLGTAAFATIFALPFFLLALFPAMLKSLPKSGGWLNAVKVVGGFVEVAFAVRYLGNADASAHWGFFSRELFLAIWAAVAILTTLYLLGHFHLPHDTPSEKVGPIRVFFAIGFMAMGIWLFSGIFGAKFSGRIGEEITGLIPWSEESGQLAGKPDSTSFSMPGSRQPGQIAGRPDASPRQGNPPISTTTGAPARTEDGWVVDDYKAALAQSQTSGKPILVDFTGYQCTNCRWMEKNMFPRTEITELMKHFVLVRLYTDGTDEASQRNKQMELERFQTITLPYYAIYSPQDKLITKWEGMTRESEDFVGFLQDGLNAKMASIQ
ncbi:MAG: Redoxin domain protein [Chlorobi bacterium]|nr:Redoxin domain protein [Chlorobiota bacterium]